MIKGKVFGTMPMSATLTPEEARAALKLLTPEAGAVPADAAVPQREAK